MTGVANLADVILLIARWVLLMVAFLVICGAVYYLLWGWDRPK